MKKVLIVLSLLLFSGCGEKIEYKNIKVEEISSLGENVLYLDVRSRLEFSNGHIEDAVNIDVEELENNVGDLIPNKDRIIIVYCQSGNRSAVASKKLIELGYKNIYNLVGGFNNYKEV